MISNEGEWDSSEVLVEFTNSRYLKSRGIGRLTLASNQICIKFRDGKKEDPVSATVKMPGLMEKDCSYILVNTDTPLSLDIPFVCLNKSHDYVKGSIVSKVKIKSSDAVKADVLGNDASMGSGTSVFGAVETIAIMKPIIEAVAKEILSKTSSEELDEDNSQSASKTLMYSLLRRCSDWYDKGLDVEFVSVKMDPTEFAKSQIKLREAQNAAAIRNAEYLAAKDEQEAAIRLKELKMQEEESVAIIGLRSQAQRIAAEAEVEAAKDRAKAEAEKRAREMEKAEAEDRKEIERILDDIEISKEMKAKAILDIKLEMREKIFEADLAEERRKFEQEMDRKKAEKDLRIQEAMERRNIDEQTIASIMKMIEEGPSDDIADEDAADIPESIINEINRARDQVKMAPVKGRKRTVSGIGFNSGAEGTSFMISCQESRWRLHLRGGCAPVDVNFCDFIAIVREYVDDKDEVAIYSDSGQRCAVKMNVPAYTVSSKPLVIIGNGKNLFIMAGKDGMTRLDGMHNALEAGKIQQLWAEQKVRHGTLELQPEMLR